MRRLHEEILALRRLQDKWRQSQENIMEKITREMERTKRETTDQSQKSQMNALTMTRSLSSYDTRESVRVLETLGELYNAG